MLKEGCQRDAQGRLSERCSRKDVREMFKEGCQRDVQGRCQRDAQGRMSDRWSRNNAREKLNHNHLIQANMIQEQANTKYPTQATASTKASLSIPLLLIFNNVNHAGAADSQVQLATTMTGKQHFQITLLCISIASHRREISLIHFGLGMCVSLTVPSNYS